MFQQKQHNTPPAVTSACVLISLQAQELQMDNRRLGNCDEKISSIYIYE